jgi:hypothetical protein
VIEVKGIWGFKPRYADEGFRLGTTLNEDLDTSETAFTVVSESLFTADKIIRYGDEISVLSSVTSLTLNVVQRGDNGSVAAVHSSGANVYYWQPMEDIRDAVLETALAMYKRRSGKSDSSTEIVTPAGIILPPREIPVIMGEMINTLRKRL